MCINFVVAMCVSKITSTPPKEVAELVKGRDYISEIINNPINKNKLDKVLIRHRKIFTKP